MTIPPFKSERQLTCPHGRYVKSCPSCAAGVWFEKRSRDSARFEEQIERTERVERARKLDVQAR
jgi:hypothetical protein